MIFNRKKKILSFFFLSCIINNKVIKVKLKIEKMDYEGRGISHVSEKVCFVKKALPGELVEAKLLQDEKRFSIYETTEVLTASPLRKTSLCPFSKECGGCALDIMSYEDSVSLKKEMLKELFKKNNLPIKEFEIVKSSHAYGYRNKISLKIENGQLGYYKEETHQFVPIKNCLLAKPAIQNLMKDFSLFHIKNGDMTIRANQNDELLLSINTKEKIEIEKELIEKHKIAGIVWNNKCVYNSSFFIEHINHLFYKVHANSFFQVNIDIAEKIALDIEKEFKKEDILYDLYCGVGYFSLKLARITKQVLGIELNQNAILNANYNASLNKISNVSFHLGKVEDILEKIPLKANKVIVDPPRSGLHKNVRKVLKENKFEKIIYISCNPKTLARDLQDLIETYTLTSFKAYDMFPFTKHIECVCILSKKMENEI